MRLEGQSKLGYYPTPDQTLARIITWLSIFDPGVRRYLDPCCGKGEALAAIAEARGPAETYGIELSDVRALVAEKTLTRVINTGYENAVISNEAFSLILLNPPYDGEGMTGGGVRMEETFLITRETTAKLVEGGVLIYIIPHSRINEKIARHLAGWYDDLRCFKIAEDEYEVFHQCVIFGVRHKRYAPPSGDALAQILAWVDGKQVTGYTEIEEEVEKATEKGMKRVKVKRNVPVMEDLPCLPAGSGEYDVPPSESRIPFRFVYIAVSPEEVLREADLAVAKLDTTAAWAELAPRTSPEVYVPVMSPKKGHIALQVSGGLLGTNLVKTKSGTDRVIKGAIRKIAVAKGDDEEEVEVDDPEKKELKRVEINEKFENLFTTLDENGELRTTSDPTEIGHLLDEYVGQLAEQLQARNKPRYDLKPEPWEWAVFDDLSKGRVLPGRGGVTGLTDFQKHLAIAMGRLCLASGAGFTNAEMGSGKSTISIAVCEYLQAALKRRGSQKSAYPAMVVGPGIVTGAENWPKEIQDVIPGAVGKAVTIGVKPVAKPVKISVWLKSLGLILIEEDFAGLSAKESLAKVNTAARYQGIAFNESALLESFKRTVKNPPARRKGATGVNLLDGRIGGYLWLGENPPRDTEHQKELERAYSLPQFITAYQAGNLPNKSFAVLSYETAKLGSGRAPAMKIRAIRVRGEENGISYSRLVKVCTCPVCGAIVSEKYDPESSLPLSPITPLRTEEWIGLRRRFCQAPKPRRVWDAEAGKHVLRAQDEDGHAYVCGAPLFEESTLRRTAAASYAAKKAKKAFGLLLVDEVHQAKGKGTGVGWALGALASASRWTVGLTGTLFGGYSTSIFMLWYRLISAVRKEFPFNGDQAWANKFGLIKRTFYVHKDVEEEQGAFTGTHFFETVNERPGISPQIVRYGLPYCTFSSLKDIGLPLPAYSEEIVRIPMSDGMKAQYQEADGAPHNGLFRWAMEEKKKPDGKGAISVWLNTALNRPDAMFRSEIVRFNRRLSGKGRFATHRSELVRDFPAVIGPGELLPKEQWLADICQAEIRQGRKTLVFIRQTGERDIQERLKAVLETRDLRVAILKPSLAPEKRASWIKKHADEFDVLLTNARLVQVGLNLTMLSTAIFYEMVDFSLYVTWQAMRRLYRPGAPKPVKLYFPVYKGALEESVLDLVGQKMAAAMMFYGDEVAGALTEGDEGDLLNDLVRVALGEIEVGRAEGMFSLGNQLAVTEAAYGSPTLPSPVMDNLVWGDAVREWAQRLGKTLPERRPTRKKSSSDTPKGQMGLGI